ncbi:MAG: UvrD-helicase domain-containing protein [Gemmatimonadaceae bacterium]|nr:UvrD-helicase domain-containing protein [Gemmatimonadaceae bacterium]
MTPNAPAPFRALDVSLDPGITLVEASAGTGKTFAITRLLLRLLLERKVESLARILVVTFTEKATQELVTRIRTTLREAEQVWSNSPPERTARNGDLFALAEEHGADGGAIIAAALRSLDDLAVFTIHGFCQRVLGESALESRIPFRTTFIEDDTEPFGRAARDWARKRLINDAADATLVVDSGKPFEGWVKSLVIPYRRHERTRIALDAADGAQGLLAHFTSVVHESFEEEKRRRHLRGFDDLLRTVKDVLIEEGSDGPLAQRIRARFGAALIDEFQDTDRTQYPIFSTAFAGCPLFLIGDPKQSIYRFRGADIRAYLRAASEASRRFTLLENYRSSDAYVRAVEALFTRMPLPFGVSEDEIDFPRVTAATTPEPPGTMAGDGRAALEWWWVDGSHRSRGIVSKEAAAEMINDEIAHEIVQLQQRGVPYGRMAVLVRYNRSARALKRVLDRARIPAVIGADDDVLQSDEANEIVRLATAMADPGDGGAVRSALATRLWGSDAREVASMLRPEQEGAWQGLVERLTAARESWRSRGFAVAMSELLAERDMTARLLALPDGERRMTNVRHVIELLHDEWAEAAVPPEGFAAWMARERTVPNTPLRRELRLETDSAAVQLLTVHKAKGLEFDVVFCPELWDRKAEKAVAFKVIPANVVEGEEGILDLGGTEHDARLKAQAREMDEEELRLTYVALTRAIHRCYVVFGEIGKPGKASVHASLASESALGWLLRDAESGTASRATLQAMVSASGGTMAMREVGHTVWNAVAPALPPVATVPRPRTLQLARGQLATWQLTSFTALVADTHSEEGRDVADPLLLRSEPHERRATVGFRAFPAGRVGGIALHDVFESLDFSRPLEPRSREMVQRTLGRHGILDDVDTAEQRVDDVMGMLDTVCRAPVPGGGFSLAEIPLRAGVREWRFDLSVASASVRRIADALALHGSAHARAYVPFLRTLRDSAVGGYLSGVIDLAFERDGQWWVMDWKSNHPGDDDDDYAPAALSNAMMQAHYTLQYHLYCLALHRHLRVRQRDYDPSRHWGGVAYVFLRGVDGASDRGWFRDAPTPALLDALDIALGRRA